MHSLFVDLSDRVKILRNSNVPVHQNWKIVLQNDLFPKCAHSMRTVGYSSLPPEISSAELIHMTHTRTHTRTIAHTYQHTHTRINCRQITDPPTHENMHMQTNAHTHTYTQALTCTYSHTTYTHKQTHKHKHMCTHTHPHTHTHTQTYRQIQ